MKKFTIAFTIQSILLLACILGIFHAVFFPFSTRLVLSRGLDLRSQFIPWRQYGFNQLKQGRLVLWNPYVFLGTPFLGLIQTALLYPLNWIYMVLPLAQATNLGILLNLWISGLGMIAWMHSKHLHPSAQFLSALIYVFGGAQFMHLYPGHLSVLCTVAWIPFVFLFVEKWMETLKIRWMLLGTVILALQILAGQIQYAYYTGIMVFIYIAMNVKFSEDGIKKIGGILIAYLGAVALTAIQFLTSWVTALECWRNHGLPLKVAGSFSFPPENMLTLIFPDFFGNLRQVPYWGRWYLWETSIFIGITASLLALYGTRYGSVQQKKHAGWLAGISFFLSLGLYSPAFPLWCRWIPYFNHFRGDAKFNIFVCLFLAVLAGIGLDQLMTQEIHFSIGYIAFIIGMFCGVVDFWGYWEFKKNSNLLWYSMLKAIPWFEYKFGKVAHFLHSSVWNQVQMLQIKDLGMCSLVCFLFFLILYFSKSKPFFRYGLVILAGFELLGFAKNYCPTFSLSHLKNMDQKIEAFLKQHPTSDRTFGLNNQAILIHAFDIAGYDSLILSHYVQLMLQTQKHLTSDVFGSSELKHFSRWFRFLRLKYFFELNYHTGEVRVLKAPWKPLPEFLILHHWQVIHHRKKLIDQLLNPAFHPRQMVYLNHPPDPLPNADATEKKFRVVNLNPDRLDISVYLSHAALLLMTNAYDPGWRAVALPNSVQSKYDVLQADDLFQVIPLKSGWNHFKMIYRPWAYVWGKWISIITLGLLGLSTLVGWWMIKKREG
jgi:hypothetical protein